MPKLKEYKTPDGKPATFVNELRRIYGVKIWKTGVPITYTDTALEVTKNGLEIKVIKEVDEAFRTGDYETIDNIGKKYPNIIEVQAQRGNRGKVVGKGQPDTATRIDNVLKHVGSDTENAYNYFMTQVRKDYPEVANVMGVDITGLVNDILPTLKTDVGRHGKPVKSKAKNPERMHTETGFLSQGGIGFLGNMDRLETSYPTAFNALNRNPEFKQGGLSKVDYDKLKKMLTKAGIKKPATKLKSGDFMGLLDELNVIGKTATGLSEFTKNPELGHLFFKYMNYRIGKGYTQTHDEILNTQLMATASGIPEDKVIFYTQIKRDRDIITSINEINLTHILRNPYLSDEDLKNHIMLVNGNVAPDVEDIFKELYNESYSHLSEGGLLEIKKEDASYITNEEIMSDIIRGYGNAIKITPQVLEALKDKIPIETYKKIKEQMEKGELDPETRVYLEKLIQGWNAVKIGEIEGPLWEKVKKEYRKRTPKYKVRFEAWFKAARIEFGGGSSKNYPVLMELATRIAQSNYKDLFEIDTEIKVWYQNWGNDDDRIVELIERLEANTGEMADWSLAEKQPPNAVKEIFQKQMMEEWVLERTEFYRNKGYTQKEIELALQKELENF